MLAHLVHLIFTEVCAFLAGMSIEINSAREFPKKQENEPLD